MKSASRSRRTIARQWAAVGFVLVIVATGIALGTDNVATKQSATGIVEDGAARRMPQPTFVAGQVIVKLKDGHTQGLAAAAQTSPVMSSAAFIAILRRSS